MNPAFTQLARLLLVKKPADLAVAIERLEELTGASNVAEKVWQANQLRFDKKIKELGLKTDAKPQQIYDKLIKQVVAAEQEFTKVCKKHGFAGARDVTSTVRLLDFAKRITNYKHGFFLRTEVAEQILKKHPPIGQLRHLGHRTVTDLLKHEDIFEIFAALRFSEDKEWAGKLLSFYHKLTPADFEERPITTLVLDPHKWGKLAMPFIKKKYHNQSHSKEMGIIFSTPIISHAGGLNLRTMALVQHYFAEVHFYSHLFKLAAQKHGENFGEEVAVAILGDTDHQRSKPKKSFCWPVLQRYMSKDPHLDWRFFVPHVMPEALHWRRALHALAVFAKENKIPLLSFWEQDLDWVGMRMDGEKSILTLNAEDLIFSYAKGLPFKKHYIYHWRESLWNKIFSECVGEQKMIELMAANLTRGKICEI